MFFLVKFLLKYFGFLSQAIEQWFGLNNSFGVTII